MDPATFSQLYAEHWWQIYVYMLRRRLSKYDAEDLTEITFVQAWLHKDTYEVREGKGALRWLYRIAHNTYIDYLRVLHPVVSLEAQLTEPSSGQHFEIEDIDALESLIQQLTSIQQTVMRLRYLQQLTTAEIGQRLDIREGSVRGIEFRAIQTLRRMNSLENSGVNGQRS
jgi:RNA polymerase sigma-70 factor (ECF subfamily)